MKSNRLWAIGTTIIVVAVVVLGWMLGISPKLAEAAGTSSTADQVDAENSALQQQIIALKAAYENIDAVREELDELEESMPPEHDIPDFLRELSAMAGEHAVTINSITIGNFALYASTNPTPSPEVAAATAAMGAQNLVMMPITLKLTGTDIPLINFNEDLQTGDERLFLTTKFVVQSGTSVTEPPPVVTIDGEVQPPAPAAVVFTAEITGFIFVVLNPNVVFEEPDEVEVEIEPETPTPTPTPTEPTPTPTETVAALRH